MTRKLDLWFVRQNRVFTQVPFDVAIDWLHQARLDPEDRVRADESTPWQLVRESSWLSPHLISTPPKPASNEQGNADTIVAEEEADLELPSFGRKEEEDDDVDMIPLIDISLVLLIFFMMSSAISAVSRVAVPEASNAVPADKNPKLVRIDIDRDKDGLPVYSVAMSNAAPQTEDDQLRQLDAVMSRVNAQLANVTGVARVRIAAHGELPFERVEDVIRELDKAKKFWCRPG